MTAREQAIEVLRLRARRMERKAFQCRKGSNGQRECVRAVRHLTACAALLASKEAEHLTDKDLSGGWESLSLVCTRLAASLRKQGVA